MAKKELILVSGCLAGLKCRFNGTDRSDKRLVELVRKGEAIPVCPEQLGGLPTPRPPCGLFGCDPVKVLTAREGRDQTTQFVKGAEETLRLAKLFGIKKAIMKNKSPSCGVTKTWRLTGDFKNRLVDGSGVAAELLRKSGIEVISKEDL